MNLLPATLEDIPFIIELENRPENLYIHAWSHDKHREEMESGDALYFLIEDASNLRSGYCILRGLNSGGGRIELKRIVIATPGQGLGRQVVELLIHKTFHEYCGHTLWLEVYEKNPAYALYHKLGFLPDGPAIESSLRLGGTDMRLSMAIKKS